MSAKASGFQTTRYLSSHVTAIMTGIALLFASCAVITSSSASQVTPVPRPNIENALPNVAHDEREIRDAVSTFLWAISNRHAPGVWHFTDEDHVGIRSQGYVEGTDSRGDKAGFNVSGV